MPEQIRLTATIDGQQFTWTHDAECTLTENIADGTLTIHPDNGERWKLSIKATDA